MSVVSGGGDAPGQGTVPLAVAQEATPLVDVNPSVPIEEETLSHGVAGESVKLSILAKAKAIEEQVTCTVLSDSFILFSCYSCLIDETENCVNRHF